MIKTLTKHGNSLALVIDKPVLDLLKIEADTPLEITTDGSSLTIRPATKPARKARVAAAVDRANTRYAKALKKLAE